MSSRSSHVSTRALRAGVSHASLLILLLIAVGCALGPVPPQPTPTITPYFRPTALPSPTLGAHPPAVNGPLAPAPTDCATVAPPRTFTLPPDFGGGFHGEFTFAGSSPAWALGPGTPLRVQQPDASRPYPSAKVMWIVGPNYFYPVTLTGRELRSNTPMWFEIYPSAGERSIYTTQVVLDPGAPNRGSAQPRGERWNIWGIGILVLSAGCYELDVKWAEGSWRTVFAAGS